MVCGTPLGSGAFGKVDTYRYHGAALAVKELKAGADEESIGVCPAGTGRSDLGVTCHPELGCVLCLSCLTCTTASTTLLFTVVILRHKQGLQRGAGLCLAR